MDIFLDILLKPPQPFIGLFLTSEYYAHLFPHAMYPNFTCVFTLCLSILMYNIYLGYETTDVGRGVILK